jgi:urease subunit alpha
VGADRGGNASVHGVEPTRYGPDWGGTDDAPRALAVTFVSGAAADAGISRMLGTARRVVPIAGTRDLTRADLLANTAVPAIEVDPADGAVRLDGRILACEPVDAVPLNRRYLLT